jgi:hexaprenyl-diphosphate synthase
MIGRSMTLCASLNHSAVMSIFSGLVSSLVEGELLQAEETEDWSDTVTTREEGGAAILPDWKTYLTKTHLKTGSLISKALRCSALLNAEGEDNSWADAAAVYGHELGMAFQVSAVSEMLNLMWVTGDDVLSAHRRCT